MGRKSTVTAQQLLDAGLQIIISQGYSAVTIKSVAGALGCSTQPIAWVFGNIDTYRRELRRHATAYMHSKMAGSSSQHAAKAGYAYIDMAIDEPNLIRYLRSDEKDLRQSGGIAFIFDREKSLQRHQYWEKALGIGPEAAEAFVTFCVLHTEGIVSMLLSGVLPPDRREAYRLLEEGSTAYAMYLKGKDEPYGNRDSN